MANTTAHTDVWSLCHWHMKGLMTTLAKLCMQLPKALRAGSHCSCRVCMPYEIPFCFFDLHFWKHRKSGTAEMCSFWDTASIALNAKVLLKDRVSSTLSSPEAVLRVQVRASARAIFGCCTVLAPAQGTHAVLGWPGFSAIGLLPGSCCYCCS